MAALLVVFTVGIYVTLRGSLVSNLDDALSTRLAELHPIITGTDTGAGLPANVLSGGDEPGDAYVRMFYASGELADSIGGAGFDIALPDTAALSRVMKKPLVFQNQATSRVVPISAAALFWPEYRDFWTLSAAC